MSWRPKDWYKEHSGSGKPVFEAGADAMLVAVIAELEETHWIDDVGEYIDEFKGKHTEEDNEKNSD